MGTKGFKLKFAKFRLAENVYSVLRIPLSKVKPFLSLHDLEKVINACISSRLDYCNVLLTNGVNKSSLNRLQVVQNAAARLLYWLPVCFRINFNLILSVLYSFIQVSVWRGQSIICCYGTVFLHVRSVWKSINLS